MFLHHFLRDVWVSFLAVGFVNLCCQSWNAVRCSGKQAGAEYHFMVCCWNITGAVVFMAVRKVGCGASLICPNPSLLLPCYFRQTTFLRLFPTCKTVSMHVTRLLWQLDSGRGPAEHLPVAGIHRC